MNTTVKNILIVILFLACISMAFLAGRLTGGNETASVTHDQLGTSSSEMDSLPPSRSADNVTSTIPDREISSAPSSEDLDAYGEDARLGPIDESADAETAEYENPPASGFRPDPYELRSMFPDNRALPPVDRAEFVAKQKEKDRRNRQYGQIAANKATVEEINAYYAEQTALAEDSAVILTYILTEYEDRMSEEDIKKHEFLLESFEKRLERIPQKKAEALARIQ